ncbi:rhodanese-like domain-containing protein [soil metagenome]
MSTIAISAYKFIELGMLPERKASLKAQCQGLNLKGTILLAEEGININLAGTRAAIDAIKDFFKQDILFEDLFFKESLAEPIPFKRMIVKIKKEIITMGVGSVKTLAEARHALSPQQLKQWLDEGRDFTLLDTRNTYEVEMGTFTQAKSLNIKHFRHFPAAIATQSEAAALQKPVVLFCTGGVRCDKALPWMYEQGFKEVYQLDGGILNYFQQCGKEHYRGSCFVFDDRMTLSEEL